MKSKHVLEIPYMRLRVALAQVYCLIERRAEPDPVAFSAFTLAIRTMETILVGLVEADLRSRPKARRKKR